MSSIKSVLASPELLRLIVSALSPLDPETPDAVSGPKTSRQQARRDLASAARVCRALTKHALDALWEVLDSLLPVFKVLPSFHDRAKRPLGLVSGITACDWAVLRSYGCRVKDLHLQWSDLECIGPCILPILMASFHASGKPLLPCLQRLHLSDLDSQTTVYTIALLSPTIQSVTVSFDASEDTEDMDIKDRDNFEMFLSSLRVASPGLQELTVFQHFCTFQMGKRHIDTISGFSQLQAFSSHVTMNPAAWSRLGSICSLRHLDISIRSIYSRSDLEMGYESQDTDAYVTPDCYSLTLPTLHTAKVKGPPETLTIFVDNLKAPALHSLTFNVSFEPTPSDFEKFLELAKDRLPRTLRKLEIESHSLRQPYTDVHDEDEPRPVDLKPLLPPLTSLTGLEDLCLDFSAVPMHVSDDAIRVLADGLPTLVSFELWYEPPHHPEADSVIAAVPDGRRPTIAALAALARGCPQLARLHIVDVDVDAEMPKDYVVTTSDHRLRELEIAAFNSRTRGAVFGFAEKLHRIFPHLGNVQSQGGWPEEGAGSGWDVAKAYLGYLQKV